eukprot:Gb_11189 [translate_table: standard]
MGNPNINENLPRTRHMATDKCREKQTKAFGGAIHGSPVNQNPSLRAHLLHGPTQGMYSNGLLLSDHSIPFLALVLQIRGVQNNPKAQRFNNDPKFSMMNSRYGSPSMDTGSNSSGSIFSWARMKAADQEEEDASPRLWRPGSTSYPRYPPSVYPTSARAEEIAKGRQELMQMLDGLPESTYELSLSDLVEHKNAVEKPNQEMNAEQSQTESKEMDPHIKGGGMRGKRSNKKKAEEAKPFLLNIFVPIGLTFRSSSKPTSTNSPQNPIQKSGDSNEVSPKKSEKNSHPNSLANLMNMRTATSSGGFSMNFSKISPKPFSLKDGQAYQPLPVPSMDASYDSSLTKPSNSNRFSAPLHVYGVVFSTRVHTECQCLVYIVLCIETETETQTEPETETCGSPWLRLKGRQRGKNVDITVQMKYLVTGTLSYSQGDVCPFYHTTDQNLQEEQDFPSGIRKMNANLFDVLGQSLLSEILDGIETAKRFPDPQYGILKQWVAEHGPWPRLWTMLYVPNFLATPTPSGLRCMTGHPKEAVKMESLPVLVPPLLLCLVGPKILSCYLIEMFVVRTNVLNELPNVMSL